MRELKIGDRVVDWTGEAGTVISVSHSDNTCPEFVMRYDNGDQESWGWVEFGSDGDFRGWQGTLRFEDTVYPEWPR